MTKLTFKQPSISEARALGVPDDVLVQVEMYSDEEMAKNYVATNRQSRTRIAQWFPNVTKKNPWSR